MTPNGRAHLNNNLAHDRGISHEEFPLSLLSMSMASSNSFHLHGICLEFGAQTVHLRTEIVGETPPSEYTSGELRGDTRKSSLLSSNAQI